MVKRRAVILSLILMAVASGSTRMAKSARGINLAAAQTLAAAACTTPLALTLQPGQHWPGGQAMPIPSDLPPGTPTIRLPLYPDATVTQERETQPSFSYPAERYMKSSGVTYHVAAGEDQVVNWYQTALSACGYHLDGSSSSGVRGVEKSRGISYGKQEGRNHLSIALSFAPSKDGGTLVLYVVIELTPPIYPAPGSILRVPGMPIQLTITAYSSMNTGVGALRPLRTVTVRDRVTVASLAREINALPKVTGVSACPADDGSHDTLVFHDSDGSRRVVTVGLRGCEIVAAPRAPAGRLYDDLKLLPRIQALLRGPGSRAIPAVYDARTLRPLHVRRLGSSPGRFLTTGQNGWNMLYTSSGNLVLESVGTRKTRTLAHGIADATLDIDDFQALALPAGAKSRTTLKLIDTRSNKSHSLNLPAGATLLGRSAGAGPIGLSDALACDLQYLWFVQARQIHGIDPLHPANDSFHSKRFLPIPVPGQRMAISCTGDLLAVYRPAQGIVIYHLGASQNGGGRVLRRVAVHDVSFLSWAPGDTHLAFRSGSQLTVLNVQNGRIRPVLQLGSDVIHGAAWDPWGHVIALSVTAPGAPVTSSRIALANSDGSGTGSLALPFTGATDLQWSPFRGKIIGLTQVSAAGTQPWAISLPPMPTDPGQPT